MSNLLLDLRFISEGHGIKPVVASIGEVIYTTMWPSYKQQRGGGGEKHKQQRNEVSKRDLII